MYVVAVSELRSSESPWLEAFAGEIGTTLYELRLVINGGFPAVVMVTADEPKAAAVFAYIRRHGHRAVLVARRDITPSKQMTALRDFSFDSSGIAPSGGSGDRLPYGDVLAIVRATHRTTTVTTKDVKEKQLRPGMALATGGLVSSKTTTRQVTTKTEERQQVLYLFRGSGAPAWILREREARFGGLGAELRPTSLENFATTIRTLRKKAPQAVYDERLVNARPLIRGLAEGVEAVDLLAHLMAEDLRQ